MGTRLKKGVKLLEELPGDGEFVQRQHEYILSIRLTLNKGQVLASPPLSFYLDGNQKQHDDGFLDHCARIDRGCLIPGLFYAVEGMRIGGHRKVAISPHLAYGYKGIPDRIPANAKLIAEIKVLREVDAGKTRWENPGMDDAEALTQDDLCERYQITRLSLWQWRRAGRLPAPILIGKMVRWKKSTIEQWEANGRPRVSPCLEEAKEDRDRAYAHLGQLKSESQDGNEGDPIKPVSPEDELRRLTRDVEQHGERMLDLMLELALLIDEAGRWHGPPLEHLLKDSYAANRQWGNLSCLLEKILAGQEG